MGCSDELTFYRCFCSSYKPLADDAQNGCPISTVFADLQPEPATQQGKRQPLDHGRAAAAQQCGIQSTLLVPVYDFDSQSPSCVFELAQQQPDVDFTLAVQILQDVAEVSKVGRNVNNNSAAAAAAPGRQLHQQIPGKLLQEPTPQVYHHSSNSQADGM